MRLAARRTFSESAFICFHLRFNCSFQVQSVSIEARQARQFRQGEIPVENTPTNLRNRLCNRGSRREEAHAPNASADFSRTIEPRHLGCYTSNSSAALGSPCCTRSRRCVTSLMGPILESKERMSNAERNLKPVPLTEGAGKRWPAGLDTPAPKFPVRVGGSAIFHGGGGRNSG